MRKTVTLCCLPIDKPSLFCNVKQNFLLCEGVVKWMVKMKFFRNFTQKRVTTIITVKKQLIYKVKFHNVPREHSKKRIWC